MDAKVQRTQSLQGRITIAGSKNYTSRLVLSTALAGGESVVINPAPIDDAQAMAECCERLGAEIAKQADAWRIRGVDGVLKGPARLNVRNAGAVVRFLMAVCATSEDPIELYTPYPESLGRRPHSDLIEALRSLGAEVSSADGGRLPVTVRRGSLRAGKVDISGKTSSQFLSALLFLAPLLDGVTEIRVSDVLRSRPLVRQTLEVLRLVGIDVEADDNLIHFRVEGPQRYTAGTYRVPGDWPAAAAILSAAAVVESDVTVEGLVEDDQGELRILDVLREMGADVEADLEAGWVRVRGGRPLKPVEVNGDLATDAVLSMVAMAAFADGTSRFYNVENLRYKECDRITDFCHELRKAGVHVEERRSEIIVHGRNDLLPGGARIDAHYDHRVLMALTIVGLRCKEPLLLSDAHHVAKSYPDFFADMEHLGANLQIDSDYYEQVAVKARRT